MHAHSDTLLALCDYGLPAELSTELMSRYGDEMDIPLCELDSTESEY